MDNWSSDNIRQFEKMIAIVKANKRISGSEITIVYNSVFNKNLSSTSCSSCINSRYKELKKSYDKFIEELKKQEQALTVIDEFMTEDVEEIITPKKRGRTKKQE